MEYAYAKIELGSGHSTLREARIDRVRVECSS
jgi:hypothetical protein